MNSLTLQHPAALRRAAIQTDRPAVPSAAACHVAAARRANAMRNAAVMERPLMSEALTLMRDFQAAVAGGTESLAAYPRLLLALYRESGALTSAVALSADMAAASPADMAAALSADHAASPADTAAALSAGHAASPGGCSAAAPGSFSGGYDARLAEEVRTYARKWIGEADARLAAATPKECCGIMGWYDMTYRVAYGHAAPADTLLPIILRLLRTLDPADLSTSLLLTNLIDQLPVSSADTDPTPASSSKGLTPVSSSESPTPASSAEGLTPVLRAELAQFRTRQLTQWLREARAFRPLAAYPPAEALRIANCLCATDLRTLLPATHLPGGQDLLKANLLTGLLPLANRLLRPLRQTTLATPTAETLQTYLLNLHAHVGLPDYATLRQLLHQHLSASPNPYIRAAALLASRRESR